MKPRKLTRRQFARALRQGRGAAFLHVKEYGDKDKGIKEEILNACLNNLVYDRQCETERSAWLATIIDRTGFTSEYVTALLAALRQGEHTGKDLEQQINLGRQLFERGYFEFAGTIAPLTRQKPLPFTALEVRCSLVEMFGLPGFARAAELMLDEQDSQWGIHDLYEYTADAIDSEDSVREYLEANASNNSKLAAVFKIIEEEKARSTHTHSNVEKNKPDLAKVLEKIEQETTLLRYPGYCVRFGKSASQEDLETILSRIETTSNEIKLNCYLAVFWCRAMPRLPENSRELLKSDNKTIHRALCRALGNTGSLQVRELALSILLAGGAENIITALRILEKSCTEDIWLSLSAHLSSLITPEQIHSAGLAIRNIYWDMDTHVDPGPLLWLCELTPCSLCRHSALRKLMAEGLAPESIVFEAQWDANYEMRFDARAHLANQTLNCSAN